MKPTQELHELGQSLWLDNITRTMLGDGTLQGYIDELSVTGLTSNPTIFDKAISGGDAYDEQIAEVAPRGEASARGASSSSSRSPTCATPTELFAADPRAHRRRRRLGLARGLAAARRRHRGDDRAGRRAARQAPGARTSSSRSPAPRPGLTGDRGVDLRRRPDQRHPALLDASSTWPRPRPTCAGSNGGSRPGSTRTSPRSPRSSSAAGTSRSPTRCRPSSATGSGSRSAAAPTAPTASCSTPSAGSAWRTRARGRSGCSSPAPGPRIPTPPTPSTSRRFAAPFTVNTMPDTTLHAFADHGEVGEPLPADGGDAEQVLAEFAEAGIDVDALAARLQEEGKRGLRQVLGRAARSDRSEREAAERVSEPVALREPRGLAGAGAPSSPRSATATCATSSPPTRRAASASSPTAPASTSTSPRTGSPTRR